MRKVFQDEEEFAGTDVFSSGRGSGRNTTGLTEGLGGASAERARRSDVRSGQGGCLVNNREGMCTVKDSDTIQLVF